MKQPGEQEPRRIRERRGTAPIRVFLFEPHSDLRNALSTTLPVYNKSIRVTAFDNPHEAISGIEEAYEKDPQPFDKAVVASGTNYATGTFSGEPVIQALIDKGMDPRSVAVHSASPVFALAARHGTDFVFKGDSDTLLHFLSRSRAR